jgi:hypothetical protein
VVGSHLCLEGSGFWCLWLILVWMCVCVTTYVHGCWASMVGVRLGLWLSCVWVLMFILQLGLCFMWQAQLAWSHWKGWWMWTLYRSIIWEECACMCIWCACISTEVLGSGMLIKVWHTFNVVCTCSSAVYVWPLNAISIETFHNKEDYFYHIHLNCNNWGYQNTVFRKIFWFRGGEMVWG